MADIIIEGAKVHNLRDIDVRIPRNSLTVVTGLSGSGKSSLAFDTLYAEGQRRYVESLSAYARQFLDQMQKPDVERIEGLSPAIAIEQRTSGGNPRSIVATVTEIHDYLRLLYGNVGVAHCPKCGKPVRRQSAEEIVESILKFDYVPLNEGDVYDWLPHMQSAEVNRLCIDNIRNEQTTDLTILGSVKAKSLRIDSFDYLTSLHGHRATE